ncbi:hypothetical protein OH77DRAFT_1425310 [Trametes cingulata]|nr:hypothetical protein OH77DRAFT_1425310 [Trametes cingulata]
MDPIQDAQPTQSRKRARTDGAEDSSSGTSSSATVTVEQDAELWLEDGNIVIVAGDLAFRAYRGILARRSEVFRDLFSIPNPQQLETMDGVPVVRVSDSPEELRYLLMVLCCGTNYFNEQDEAIAIKFPVLSALIRLSHKYAVHDVLNQALSRLKKHRKSLGWKVAKPGSASSRYVDMEPKDAIAVVHLAVLTDTSTLLPSAYLQCTSLGPELFERAGQPDGLSAHDLSRIINGKALLVEEGAKMIFVALKCLTCSYDNCLVQPDVDCQDAAKRLLRMSAVRNLVRLTSLQEISDCNGEILNLVWAEYDPLLCKACIASFHEDVLYRLQHVWARLPGIFDLPNDGWDVAPT